jgi:hypothetical protein
LLLSLKVQKAVIYLCGDRDCYRDAGSVINCVVRDLTNAGACVELPSTIELPEALDLTFNGGLSFRPCRRVWRTLSKTGVKFI